MKVSVIILFFAITGEIGYSQDHNMQAYANLQPLFRVIDSVARHLENQGKLIDLIYYSSGHSVNRGLILWKDGKTHCGSYFRKEVDKAFTKTNINQGKVNSILSLRLFSDSCDLCQLANVKEEDRIDHEYIMYLKRTIGSICDEIYFVNSAYLTYLPENCLYDVRKLVALLSERKNF